jgi:chromosome segregation ATPase
MIVIAPVICILQAELNAKESQVADLQENIKSQQSETSKAKSELTTALEEMEKLKKDFKADRTSWESDKAALLKRAEETEAALKPVAEELSGLKHQINTMTAAVFGNIIPICYHTCS